MGFSVSPAHCSPHPVEGLERRAMIRTLLGDEKFSHYCASASRAGTTSFLFSTSSQLHMNYLLGVLFFFFEIIMPLKFSWQCIRPLDIDHITNNHPFVIGIGHNRKYWSYYPNKSIENIPGSHQYHPDEIDIFFQVPKQHYHMP